MNGDLDIRTSTRYTDEERCNWPQKLPTIEELDIMVGIENVPPEIIKMIKRNHMILKGMTKRERENILGSDRYRLSHGNINDFTGDFDDNDKEK